MPSQFAPNFAWAQGTFEVADAAALGALSGKALGALIAEAYPDRNLVGAGGIFPETSSSPSRSQLVEKLAPIGVPAIDLTKTVGRGKAYAAGWSKKSDGKTTAANRGRKRSAKDLSASAATDRSEGTARPAPGQAKASRSRDGVRDALKMAVADRQVRQKEQDANAHATVSDQKGISRQRVAERGGGVFEHSEKQMEDGSMVAWHVDLPCCSICNNDTLVDVRQLPLAEGPGSTATNRKLVDDHCDAIEAHVFG